MGHIRYRQGDLGSAALFYERSALFAPPIPEVRQNLNHIHSKTGSLVFAPNDLRPQLAAWLSPRHWMQIVILSGGIVVLCVVFSLLFLRAGAARTLLLTFASFIFIIGGLALLGWSWHPTFEHIKAVALVTAPDVHAYTAASATSGTVSELPPGSQVRQLETRGAWTYVEIPGEGESNRGWVQSNALAALWPEEFGGSYLE
jgi:hypothetical protein